MLIIAVAPLAERAFGAPQLAAVLIWLTIPVILSGAGNTHMALRLREFGHRTLAVRSVVAGDRRHGRGRRRTDGCRHLGAGACSGSCGSPCARLAWTVVPVAAGLRSISRRRADI